MIKFVFLWLLVEISKKITLPSDSIGVGETNEKKRGNSRWENWYWEKGNNHRKKRFCLRRVVWGGRQEKNEFK